MSKAHETPRRCAYEMNAKIITYHTCDRELKSNKSADRFPGSASAIVAAERLCLLSHLTSPGDVSQLAGRQAATFAAEDIRLGFLFGVLRGRARKHSKAVGQSLTFGCHILNPQTSARVYQSPPCLEKLHECAVCFLPRASMFHLKPEDWATNWAINILLHIRWFKHFNLLLE